MLKKIRRKLAKALHRTANAIYTQPMAAFDGVIRVPKFEIDEYRTVKLQAYERVDLRYMCAVEDRMKDRVCTSILKKAVEIGALQFETHKADGSATVIGTLYVEVEKGA